MKKIMMTSMIMLLLFVAAGYADCPSSVKCSLDGLYMFPEETYYNGSHKSVKYGHDYYGPNGTVHHYVIVQCN